VRREKVSRALHWTLGIQMIKLEKRRGIADVIGMSLAPILLITPIVFMHPKTILILRLLGAYLVLLYFSLTNGLKPAAWIDKNILHIRTGMMSKDKIQENLVETMRYETNHTIERPRVGEVEAHILFIDMKGYQEWPLTISDQMEHLDQLRLFHFISDNFWPLGEPI